MNIGVTLMIVGMVTVFAVLLIIINLSKLLIKLVNKFALEENVKKDVKQNGLEIPANIMAIIQDYLGYASKWYIMCIFINSIF